MANKTKGSSKYLCNKIIINKHPLPYIGHIGHIKKPLLTNFLVVYNVTRTSIHQPKKEYKINRINNEAKLYCIKHTTISHILS